MASIAWVSSLKRWRIRWRATNRTTHRIFAGSRVFIEKAQAYRHFVQIEEQERLWRTGQVQIIESIEDAALIFASYCKRHTLRTQKHYGFVVGRFLQSLPLNILRVQQLTGRHLEEYLYRVRDAGGINRTQNAHLTVLKAFCRWIAKRYGIANCAADVPMLTEDPPDARFITKEEYTALLAAAADPRYRDRIAFLANTGLRASEFCQLVRSGSLSPLASAVTVTGKGRRRRTIPLNRTCREILQRPYLTQLAANRVSLYRQIAKIAREADIPPLGPHSLRHYFATQLLLAGIAPAKVAKILGHSIRVLEATYAHILQSDIKGVTDVLD